MNAGQDRDDVLSSAERALARAVAAEPGNEILVQLQQLAPLLGNLRRDSKSAIKHLLLALEDGGDCTVVTRLHGSKRAPNHVDHTFYTGSPDVTVRG